MSRTEAQALLDELQQYTNALILGEKPDPIKHVSGAVDGGPALLVENTSAAHASVGIEVHVGQEDAVLYLPFEFRFLRSQSAKTKHR